MDRLQARLFRLDELIRKASQMLSEQEARLAHIEIGGRKFPQGRELLMHMRQSVELLHWNRALLLWVAKQPHNKLAGLRLGNEGAVRPSVLEDFCSALSELKEADIPDHEKVDAAAKFAVYQQQIRPDLPVLSPTPSTKIDG